MISSDRLFQGFTFISWLIFVHSKQTSKYKSAKQNKNTYNEKKSSGTLIISPLSRNFRHRKLAFQEAENMAHARRTRLQADNQKHCSSPISFHPYMFCWQHSLVLQMFYRSFFSYNKHASCATAIYFSFTHPLNGKRGIYCHVRWCALDDDWPQYPLIFSSEISECVHWSSTKRYNP